MVFLLQHVKHTRTSTNFQSIITLLKSQDKLSNSSLCLQTFLLRFNGPMIILNQSAVCVCLLRSIAVYLQVISIHCLGWKVFLFHDYLLWRALNLGDHYDFLSLCSGLILSPPNSQIKFFWGIFYLNLAFPRKTVCRFKANLLWLHCPCCASSAIRPLND